MRERDHHHHRMEESQFILRIREQQLNNEYQESLEQINSKHHIEQEQLLMATLNMATLKHRSNNNTQEQATQTANAGE